MSNLTGFVGKNDVGKSSILDALDLFFDSSRKLDSNDIRKGSPKADKVEIACVFSELPPKIVLDDAKETSLQDECLLNEEGDLTIVKRYAEDSKAEVSVYCHHPSNPSCKNLLKEKDSKLRSLIDRKGISCRNKLSNVEMRRAIREHFKSSLKPVDQEISLKSDMVDRLLKYLPHYYLFKADRDNNEDDAVVRKPINNVVQDVIKGGGLENQLNGVATHVLDTLNGLMECTLSKIREFDIHVAESLKPDIPDVSRLKWAELFKDVTLIGDDGIPIEKRGSGIRRLVLLSFLRAQTEQLNGRSNGLIYAIEEPETSQHYENQKKVLQLLLELTEKGMAQVIVTTHSSTVAKELGLDNIRVVENNNGVTKIKQADKLLSDQLKGSLNFIAFRVFGESWVEYHNELYGFIEAEGLGPSCRNECKKQYGEKEWRRMKNDQLVTERNSLCYYVRNSIHHPENGLNEKPAEADIIRSIQFMETFIKRHAKELSQKGAS